MRSPARALGAPRLVAALLGACLAGAGAQEPSQPPADAKPAAAAWPAIKSVRLSMAKDQIPYLTVKDDKQAKAARQQIVAFGAGVCPVLLEAMTPRAKPELVEALAGMLDELTTAEHAPALAAAYKPAADGNGKGAPRNRYVVQRVASFGRPDTAVFLRKAAQDPDPEVAEAATFALGKLGDLEALPRLLELAKTQWAEKNYPIRESVAALKGKGATDWLMGRVHDKELATKVAVLRCLAAAGTKEAAAGIASFLDAEEHQIRAETVNALRGIVDDEPPFEKLSVFQAIEEVKKWKQKLGR